MASLRWDLRVEGGERPRAGGPALLVFNRRFGVTEPLVLAAALHRSTGRTVRIVGCPDVAPLATALRRLARSSPRSTKSPACCGPERSWRSRPSATCFAAPVRARPRST